MGEARLWYESLKPTDMDWNALQIHVLESNIQNLVVKENNISTYGDRLGMMKMKIL